MAFKRSEALPCIKNWDFISLTPSGQDRAIMMEKITNILIDGYLTNELEVTCCDVALVGDLFKSANTKTGTKTKTSRIAKIQLFDHNRNYDFENSHDLLRIVTGNGSQYFFYVHEACPDMRRLLDVWSVYTAKEGRHYL